MAATVGNAMGVAGGFKKKAEGKRMQRAGQEGIDNFEFKELQNVYKNLTPSTAGAEMRQEEAARAAATSTQALRGGGNRALVGGLGRVQAQNNIVNKDIAATVDEQVKQQQMLAAQDEAQIRNMGEVRQTNELAGYGQMMNVGMDMKYQGIADIQSSMQAQSAHAMEVAGAVGGVMTGGVMGGAMGGGTVTPRPQATAANAGMKSVGAGFGK